MKRGPQAAGAPTCVTTVPLAGFSSLKKGPDEILIQSPFRTSYARASMPNQLAHGEKASQILDELMGLKKISKFRKLKIGEH
ncbi:hypothetical protein TNCV_1833141 [Trichonephila clavipes]|nr:hypothetical protein TNCV_1833141 [Trichonephila clavipes]